MYGITLWGASSETNLNKVRVMQKKVVRSICNAEYDAHTPPYFARHSLLQLDKIHIYETVKLNELNENDSKFMFLRFLNCNSITSFCIIVNNLGLLPHTGSSVPTYHIYRQAANK